MLDITLLRKQPDFVKKQLKRLHAEDVVPRVDSILELDERRRALLTQRDELQSHRNKLNKQYGRLRGDKKLDDAMRLRRAFHAREAILAKDFDRAVNIINGDNDADLADVEAELNPTLDALMDAMRGMSDVHGEYDEEIKQIEAELDDHMLWLPNLPHESTPDGAGDDDNIPHTPKGEERNYDFEVQPHWDVGPALDIIDFERGVKMAGSRFYVLKGWGARLQRALAAFFLDVAREKGYTELYVPFLVMEDMLTGAGQFPKFRDVVYEDKDAELYLLPTAEVAVTNYHRDEILDDAQLPLHYIAQSPCFRRERASAGRDVRGIKRVHQFEKVESYILCKPEDSYAELERLTENAEALCEILGLRYRRLEICAGDLGFSATKKYDVEVWAPGSQEWLEVSSCSNTEAFQARRARIRYRPEGAKKNEFVHTLNGSTLALPRIIIAIMETYQQADGSVVIPEVLRPYLGGVEKIEAPA
jgi:seryl-tRNA synthetase